MELRGYIEKECSASLTCCSSCDDVMISDKSLHDFISESLDWDPEVDWNGEEDIDRDMVGLRYLILDEDPGEGSMNNIISKWVVNRLYGEYIGGCYSEYTCGSGNYEYFFGEEGHSISKELSSYIGKYVLIQIQDHRDLVIDTILED